MHPSRRGFSRPITTAVIWLFESLASTTLRLTKRRNYNSYRVSIPVPRTTNQGSRSPLRPPGEQGLRARLTCSCSSLRLSRWVIRLLLCTPKRIDDIVSLHIPVRYSFFICTSTPSTNVVVQSSRSCESSWLKDSIALVMRQRAHRIN